MSVFDYTLVKTGLHAIDKKLNEPYTAYDSMTGEWAPVNWTSTAGVETTSSPVALLQGTDPKPLITGTATLISVIMAVTAAYLQWTCDYTSGGHMPLKILQTIIAGLYGSMYIVFFLIFLYVPCSGIKL